MSYNLFLDDVRQPLALKDDRVWETVKSYNAFVEKITKDGLPDLISFDHDLAMVQYPLNEREMYSSIDYSSPRYQEKTGYHCALWLVQYCKEKNLPLPKWQIHSMNPVGRINIFQVLTNYKQLDGTIEAL